MKNDLLAIVREAGKLAFVDAYKQDVHAKGRADFVTGADLAISTLLTQRLTALVPGSRVLSEEGEGTNDLSGPLFIVDPVDGTTNLMYGLQLSAISVAFLVDGQAQYGLVFNPFTDEMFFAQAGRGAFLNDTPLRVNADARLCDALIGMEAGPMTAATQGPYFECLYRLHVKSRGLRCTGSAALDLAYAAAGRFSACVFPYLFPWDYAAGGLILREAGGTLTDPDGNAPAYAGRSDMLFASNGPLHGAFLAKFKA